MQSVFLNLLSPFKRPLMIILILLLFFLFLSLASFCFLQQMKSVFMLVNHHRNFPLLSGFLVNHGCVCVVSENEREKVNCSGESGVFSHELVTNDENVVIK